MNIFLSILAGFVAVIIVLRLLVYFAVKTVQNIIRIKFRKIPILNGNVVLHIDPLIRIDLFFILKYFFNSNCHNLLQFSLKNANIVIDVKSKESFTKILNHQNEHNSKHHNDSDDDNCLICQLVDFASSTNNIWLSYKNNIRWTYLSVFALSLIQFDFSDCSISVKTHISQIEASEQSQSESKEKIYTDTINDVNENLQLQSEDKIIDFYTCPIHMIMQLSFISPEGISLSIQMKESLIFKLTSYSILTSSDSVHNSIIKRNYYNLSHVHQFSYLRRLSSFIVSRQHHLTLKIYDPSFSIFFPYMFNISSIPISQIAFYINISDFFINFNESFFSQLIVMIEQLNDTFTPKSQSPIQQTSVPSLDPTTKSNNESTSELNSVSSIQHTKNSCASTSLLPRALAVLWPHFISFNINKCTCVYAQYDNAISKITFENCRFSILSKAALNNSIVSMDSYMSSLSSFISSHYTRSYSNVNSILSLETVYVDELPIIFEFYLKKPTFTIFNKQKTSKESSPLPSPSMKTPHLTPMSDNDHSQHTQINNDNPSILSSILSRSSRVFGRRRQYSIAEYYSDTDIDDYYDIMERDDGTNMDFNISNQISTDTEKLKENNHNHGYQSPFPSYLKPLLSSFHSSLSKYIYYPSRIVPYIHSALKRTLYKYTYLYSNNQNSKEKTFFSSFYGHSDSSDEEDNTTSFKPLNDHSIPSSEHYKVYKNPYIKEQYMKSEVFSMNSIGIKSTYTLRCYSPLSNIKRNQETSLSYTTNPIKNMNQSNLNDIYGTSSENRMNSKRSQVDFSINIDNVHININYIFSKYIQWFLDTKDFKGGWRVLLLYNYIKYRLFSETEYEQIQRKMHKRRINENLIPEFHFSFDVTSIYITFLSIINNQMILQLFCDSVILDIGDSPESFTILSQICTISLSQPTLSNYVSPNYLPIKNYIMYITNLDIEYNLTDSPKVLVHNNNIYLQWTPEAVDAVTESIELLLLFPPLDYIPKAKDYDTINIPTKNHPPSEIPSPLLHPFDLFMKNNFSYQILSDTVIAYFPINLFDGTIGVNQGNLQWLNLVKVQDGFQCTPHSQDMNDKSIPKNQYECFELITKVQVGFGNTNSISQSSSDKSQENTSNNNINSNTDLPSSMNSNNSITKEKEWGLQFYDTYIRFFNYANYNNMNKKNFIPIFTYVNPLWSSKYFCDIDDINVTNTLYFDSPNSYSNSLSSNSTSRNYFDTYNDLNNLFPRNTFIEEKYSKKQWEILNSKYHNTANVYYENNSNQLFKQHITKFIPSYNPYLTISESTQDTILSLSNFLVTSANTSTDSITDLYFSTCYLFATPYRFFNVWRVASEVTFSVWCVMYDIKNTMDNILPVLYNIPSYSENLIWNVSCREMNQVYPHVAAYNGFNLPPKSSLRNPLYTSKHYIKYLLWLKRNTNSSSGDSIVRLSIENLNLSAYIENIPIDLKLGFMGSETLPSISFLFKDICVSCPPYATINVSEFSISECWYSYDIQSYALLGMLQKEIIARYKEVYIGKSLMKIQITDVALSVLSFQNLDLYIDTLLSNVSSLITVMSSLPCSYAPTFAHFYNYFFWTPAKELNAQTQITMNNIELKILDHIFETNLYSISKDRYHIFEQLYQYQEREYLNDYNDLYPSSYSDPSISHNNSIQNVSNIISTSHNHFEKSEPYLSSINTEGKEDKEFNEYKEREIKHMVQCKSDPTINQTHLLRISIDTIVVLISEPPTKTYDFWSNLLEWSLYPVPPITPPDSQLLTLTINTALLYLKNSKNPLVSIDELTVKGEMITIDPPYHELFYQCIHSYYNRIPIHKYRAPIIPVMFASFDINMHSASINLLPEFLTDLNQLQLLILDPLSSYLHIGDLPLNDQLSMLLRGDIVFSADNTTLNILSDSSFSVSIPKPVISLNIEKILLQYQSPYLSFAITHIQGFIKSLVPQYEIKNATGRRSSIRFSSFNLPNTETLEQSSLFQSENNNSNDLFITKTHVLLVIDEVLGTASVDTNPDIRRKLFFLPLYTDNVNPIENESKCSVTHGYIRSFEAQKQLEHIHLQPYIAKSFSTKINIVILGSKTAPFISLSPFIFPYLVHIADVWMNEITLRPFTLSPKLPQFTLVSLKDLSFAVTLKDLNIEFFIDKEPDVVVNNIDSSNTPVNTVAKALNSPIKKSHENHHTVLTNIGSIQSQLSSYGFYEQNTDQIKVNKQEKTLVRPSLNIQIPTVYGVVECGTYAYTIDEISVTNKETDDSDPIILDQAPNLQTKEELDDHIYLNNSHTYNSKDIINEIQFSIPEVDSDQSDDNDIDESDLAYSKIPSSSFIQPNSLNYSSISRNSNYQYMSLKTINKHVFSLPDTNEVYPDALSKKASINSQIEFDEENSETLQPIRPSQIKFMHSILSKPDYISLNTGSSCSKDRCSSDPTLEENNHKDINAQNDKDEDSFLLESQTLNQNESINSLEPNNISHKTSKMVIKALRFEIEDVNGYIIPRFSIIQPNRALAKNYKNNFLKLHMINIFYVNNEESSQNLVSSIEDIQASMNERDYLSISPMNHDYSEHIDVSVPLSSTNYFKNNSKVFTNDGELPYNSFYKFIKRDENGNIKEDHNSDNQYSNHSPIYHQSNPSNVLSAISSESSNTNNIENSSQLFSHSKSYHYQSGSNNHTLLNNSQIKKESSSSEHPSEFMSTSWTSTHGSQDQSEVNTDEDHSVMNSSSRSIQLAQLDLKRRNQVVQNPSNSALNIKNSLSKYTTSSSLVSLSLLRTSISSPYFKSPSSEMLTPELRLSHVPSTEQKSSTHINTISAPSTEPTTTTLVDEQTINHVKDSKQQKSSHIDSENLKKTSPNEGIQVLSSSHQDDYTVYEDGFMYCARIDSITVLIHPSSLEFILSLYEDIESYYSQSVLLRLFYSRHIKPYFESLEENTILPNESGSNNSSKNHEENIQEHTIELMKKKSSGVNNARSRKSSIASQYDRKSSVSSQQNIQNGNPILVHHISTLDQYENRKILKELDPELRNKGMYTFPSDFSSKSFHTPNKQLKPNYVISHDTVQSKDESNDDDTNKSHNSSTIKTTSIHISNQNTSELLNRSILDNSSIIDDAFDEKQSIPNETKELKDQNPVNIHSENGKNQLQKTTSSILQNLFILQVRSLKLKVSCETSKSDLALYIPWARLRIYKAPVYQFIKFKTSVNNLVILQCLNNVHKQWFDEAALLHILTVYMDLHDDLQQLPQVPLSTTNLENKSPILKEKNTYQAYYNILFCTHPIKCFYHQINNNSVNNTIRIEAMKMNGYITMETVPSIAVIVNEYSAKLQHETPYGEGSVPDDVSHIDKLSLYEQYKMIIRKQSRIRWLLYRYSTNPSLMNHTFSNSTTRQPYNNTLIPESSSIGFVPYMVPSDGLQQSILSTKTPVPSSQLTSNPIYFYPIEQNNPSLLSYLYSNIPIPNPQSDNDPAKPNEEFKQNMYIPIRGIPYHSTDSAPNNDRYLTLHKLLELSRVYNENERTLRLLMQRLEVEELTTLEKHYPDIDITFYLGKLRCQFFEDSVLHHDIRLDKLDGEVVLYSYNEGEFQLHLHSLAMHSFLEDVSDPRILLPFLLEHQKQTSPLLIINCEIIPPEDHLFTIRSFVVSVHPLRIQISRVAIQNLMKYFDINGTQNNNVTSISINKNESAIAVSNKSNQAITNENTIKSNSSSGDTNKSPNTKVRKESESSNKSTQEITHNVQKNSNINKEKHNTHPGSKIQIKYLRINRINVFCSITGTRPVPGVDDFSMVKLTFKPLVYNSKIDYPLSIAYSVGKSFIYNLLSQTGRTVTGVLTVIANGLGFSSLVGLLRAPAPVPKYRKESLYSHYSSLLGNNKNKTDSTHHFDNDDSTIYFFSKEDINDRCNLLWNMDNNPIDYVSNYRYTEIMKSIEDFQRPNEMNDCEHVCYDETYKSCVSNPLSLEEYENLY